MKKPNRSAAATPHTTPHRGKEAVFRQPTEKRRLDIQRQIAAIRQGLGLPANTPADERLARYEAAQEERK